MKTTLFTTFYPENNKERLAELEACIRVNQYLFDNVVIVIDQADTDWIINKLVFFSVNTFLIPVEGRPCFNDFFEAIHNNWFCHDRINFIANTDIFFDDKEIDKIVGHLSKISEGSSCKVCFALSRWDAPGIYQKENATLFDRADSQDTWVFYGDPEFRTKRNIEIGIPGCDNALAHELFITGGFNVMNPSRSLKTFHLHNTGIRNYIDENNNLKKRIDPPYQLFKPTII